MSKDATFYVQVEPKWGYSYAGMEPPLVGAKAVRMSQKKPGRPAPGTVMVKMTLRIPDAAFLPLRPEAVVVVPEDMVVTNPLEVSAEDPDE